jgi:hypothetical protein
LRIREQQFSSFIAKTNNRNEFPSNTGIIIRACRRRCRNMPYVPNRFKTKSPLGNDLLSPPKITDESPASNPVPSTPATPQVARRMHERQFLNANARVTPRDAANLNKFFGNTRFLDLYMQRKHSIRTRELSLVVALFHEGKLKNNGNFSEGEVEVAQSMIKDIFNRTRRREIRYTCEFPSYVTIVGGSYGSGSKSK